MVATDNTTFPEGHFELVCASHVGYDSHMERATISQMRNHLSAYLQKVRAGESVLILDRNTPVARLEGVKADTDGNEQLVQLEREGLLRRPKAPIPMKQLRITPPRAKQSVLEALLEEREDDR